MKRIFLLCCLAAALLAGCAPAPSSPSVPASVSAGSAAASALPQEWTDEAVAELFLAQEQNARRTLLSCVAAPDGGEELVGVVLYAEPEHTDVRLAFLAADGTFQPVGIEAPPANPSGLAYLGEGKVRLDLLNGDGTTAGQVVTFTREGNQVHFSVEPEE